MTKTAMRGMRVSACHASCANTKLEAVNVVMRRFGGDEITIRVTATAVASTAESEAGAQAGIIGLASL